MQKILEKEERTDEIASKILQEKEMLYSKKERKKFFDKRRIEKMKKVIGNIFIAVLLVTSIGYFTLLCISTDFDESKIYDEYNELDDKELAYIVKKEMKDLTISKNVNVNFVIMYKDVPLDDFLEGKIDSEKNVTIIYNPVNKTLNMTSNIDYLIEDYKQEDITDVKKAIPKYFSMVESKIEKNVKIADFHTLVFDKFQSKENVCEFFFLFEMILVVMIVIIKFL